MEKYKFILYEKFHTRSSLTASTNETGFTSARECALVNPVSSNVDKASSNVDNHKILLVHKTQNRLIK